MLIIAHSYMDNVEHAAVKGEVVYDKSGHLNVRNCYISSIQIASHPDATSFPDALQS